MKKSAKKQISDFRQLEIKAPTKKAVKGGNSTQPIPNPPYPGWYIGIEEIFIG